MVATVEGFENAAYEALFTREFTRLVASLSVAWGDTEAAADAVQDAFVQAHRHWRKVSRYDDPAAWIRRVAINRLINAQRGRARQHAALPRLIGRDISELPESVSDIVRHVGALPDRQRIAVCLFYMHDLSIEAIADALGVSAGTIKSQLHTARATLRERMEVSDDHQQ